MAVWVALSTVDTTEETPSFLDALEIWIQKPHVLNRRLCGAKILWRGNHGDPDGLYDGVEAVIQNVGLSDGGEQRPGLTIVVRDIIPKSSDKHPTVRECVITDSNEGCVYFIPLKILHPDGTVDDVKDLGYKIMRHRQEKKLSIHTLGSLEAHITSLGYTLSWLQDTLLPKIYRWSTEKQLNTDITSLRLVPLDRYNELYQHLKKKYGIPLVEIWPERTDPQKFVFEDVAIATYLILLWEDDREKKGLTKKQSFVDLGCGNGLLVYILQAEGHPGLGIDLRKRKIWDMYEAKLKLNLKEEAITPSDETVYPEYDWLIGNHSDELTPWIPVMAARSSYRCCYFVLPCCLWDFTSRYSHKAQGVSQYRSYLDYVQRVGGHCGFTVEEDTLRIPSTKRVCFIGRTRTYTQEEEGNFDKQRQGFIDERCKSKPPASAKIISDNSDDKETISSSHGDSEQDRTGNDPVSSKRKWTNDFQAREAVEKVRNCISVDKDLKDKITSRVFWELVKLGEKDTTSKSALCDKSDADILETAEQSTQDNLDTTWNKGGVLALGQVAAMFDQADLSQLKAECGGLQTLLRNSHHIFRVQAGSVALRDWRTDDYDAHQRQKRRRQGRRETSSGAAEHAKTKLCYFHAHHPQGCPVGGPGTQGGPTGCGGCRFAHGEGELRTREANAAAR